MQGNQSDLFKLQNQLSSGKRVLTPEDDPVAASQALVVTQSKQVNAQHLENQAVARDSLRFLETNLAGVGAELQNIMERAVQGGNDSLSTADRQMIATELKARLENLMSLANAQDGTGRYLYAGYQNQVKPFVTGSVTPTPVVNPPPAAIPPAYDLATNPSINYAVQDDGTRVLQVSASVDMTIGVPGSDVFMRIKDSAGNATQRSVFDAVNNMIDFLTDPPTMLPADPLTPLPPIVPPQTTQAEANEAAITAAKAAAKEASRTRYDQSLGDLQSSLDNVLAIRSDVGAKLNQLDSLTNMGEDFSLQYDQRLSELLDLDYAKAISDLLRVKMQLEASQSSFSKVGQLNLFSYL